MRILSLLAAGALVGCGTGPHASAAAPPFTVTPIAMLDDPWSLAFLPDGRMLVAEKPGALRIVTQQGRVSPPLGGVPKVRYEGQEGLLTVALAPSYARDHGVYLSYAEPGKGGSSLALARATLALTPAGGSLQGLRVIWRQLPKGDGGQLGGAIAFAPDGKTLFLASGERQRKTPAQDPDQALGKIERLTLDGGIPADNPDTAHGPVRGATWASGNRNPYGLAYDASGRLWEVEMGPMGGDELNIVTKGANYGWPLVSNGDNYDGTPIPRHRTRPEFKPPVVSWTPVIAPSSLIIYSGAMFPQWRGSAFIGGLASQALVRVAMDGRGGAREAERFDMGNRIRCVRQGPDGALWLLEDGEGGRLLRLAR